MKKIMNSLFVVLLLLSLTTIVACSDKTLHGHNIPESSVGSWTPVEDGTITSELQGYFDKAIEGYMGCKYEAKELVAKQLVAGYNYKYLCDVTPIVPDPVTEQKYIIVYVDLDGNCSVTEIIDID